MPGPATMWASRMSEWGAFNTTAAQAMPVREDLEVFLTTEPQLGARIGVGTIMARPPLAESAMAERLMVESAMAGIEPEPSDFAEDLPAAGSSTDFGNCPPSKRMRELAVEAWRLPTDQHQQVHSVGRAHHFFSNILHGSDQ